MTAVTNATTFTTATAGLSLGGATIVRTANDTSIDMVSSGGAVSRLHVASAKANMLQQAMSCLVSCRVNKSFDIGSSFHPKSNNVFFGQFFINSNPGAVANIDGSDDLSSNFEYAHTMIEKLQWIELSLYRTTDPDESYNMNGVDWECVIEIDCDVQFG